MKSQARVKGVQIYRPLVYGNVAYPLSAKQRPADSDHTHRWTIAVKGINDTDISYFVKKVVFKLHETYANPTRSIEKPPFEVTETGWGEFEISIRVYFAPESGEKSITLYHHLKLHPWEANANAPPIPAPIGPTTPTSSEPVHSWQYDEVVFSEPTEAIHQILIKHPVSIPTRKHGNRFSLQHEQEEVDRLNEATSKVQEEIQSYRHKLLAAETELRTVTAAATPTA